jgi:transglutaminase-like putative cysteine protease
MNSRLPQLILIAMVLANALAGWAMAQPRIDDDAAWSVESDHWYLVDFAGVEAGWMHDLVESSESGFRSTTETRIIISRGASPITVTTKSVFEETRDGRPIRLISTQELAQQSTESQYSFEADKVILTTKQGGRTTTKQLPLPEGEWLTPRAAQRYFDERARAGADTISYRMIDSETGLQAIEITSARMGPEQYEHDGRMIPVTVWKSRTDIMPVDAIEKYDEQGVNVFSEVAMPIGRMVTRLSTKQRAMQAGGAKGPELMLRSFVAVDQPIRNVGKARRATYRLWTREGELPSLPESGAQRVEQTDGGARTLVKVNIDENVRADLDAGAKEEFLEPSTTINSDDELVKKLAQKAVRSAGDDPMARCDALRGSVSRHVSRKDLDTAFAGAAETALTRKGDCSEHAVLLCAMMRAAEIPSRVAMGLVYADQFAGENAIFGWHMWTQAWIDGAWVDFDATLPVRYHAGHILVGTTSLADGALANELAGIVSLLGNLEIEVVDVGYGDDSHEP